jgi:hypothetical protein
VTPASLRHLVLPTLALVAVLVVVIRPFVAVLATRRTELSRPERGFVGWMAPRGIVAAATASTFSLGLSRHGVPGADRILPATFVVIVATVTIYGLTAEPVVRRLGVAQSARTRPLLVGGDPFVIDLARALRTGGLDVLLWAGQESERQHIRRAGLELAPGELLAAATAGARLDDVTAVLLLTREDDFNALASIMLEDTVDGPVYRLAPPSGEHGVVAPYTGGELLFPVINRSTVDRRYADGATVVIRSANQVPEPDDVLLVIHPDGSLARPVQPPAAGDTMVVLEGGRR